MTELQSRIALGLKYNGIQDTWFAWYPVRTGALGTGRLRWLKKLYRERFSGVTIYQELRAKSHRAVGVKEQVW